MRRNHVIRFLFFLTLVSFVVILLSGTVNAGSTRQEGNAAYSHNDDYSLCALPSGCTASQSTGTEPDDHNSGTSI
ncbi:MAG: hypothetical protein HOE69_02430, partial [Euryarchaeota archaeon]|nr:hypothetical protein [Euryarchaeota archaeon]